MKYRETAHKMAIATAAAIEFIEAQCDWAVAIKLIMDCRDMVDYSIKDAWIAECEERVNEAYGTWKRIHFSFAPHSVEQARTEAMWKNMKGSF